MAAALTMPAGSFSAASTATVDVAAAYQVAPTPLVLVFPGPAAAAPSRSPARQVRPLRSTAATPAPVRTSTRPESAGSRCSGPGWEQRRGQAALASLRRPTDGQRYRIEFRAGRSAVLGLAHLTERRVEIFVRSCAQQSDSLLRHVIAHEIGHLVDADSMSGLRAEWLRTRGIDSGTPWFGCNACSDFATPAGDFAEVYAQWQRSAGDNRSELAPAPSSAALADLAARFF